MILSKGWESKWLNVPLSISGRMICTSQKLGTFLLNTLFGMICSTRILFRFLINIFFLQWINLKICLKKAIFLIWYSGKKIVFRKKKLIFSLENWLWKLKMTNLTALDQDLLHYIKKFFKDYHLDVKYYSISTAPQ